MLYAVLCYNAEDTVFSWSKEEDDAVMAGLDVVHQRLAVVQVGDGALIGKGLLSGTAPHAVERRVAPHQDQPGRRIARGSVLRPALQRAQAGVLERFLGRVEITEIAQEGGERLGPGGGQRSVDPGDVAHVLKVPGRNSRNGRIS